MLLQLKITFHNKTILSNNKKKINKRKDQMFTSVQFVESCFFLVFAFNVM